MEEKKKPERDRKECEKKMKIKGGGSKEQCERSGWGEKKKKEEKERVSGEKEEITEKWKKKGQE